MFSRLAIHGEGIEDFLIFSERFPENARMNK